MGLIPSRVQTLDGSWGHWGLLLQYLNVGISWIFHFYIIGMLDLKDKQEPCGFFLLIVMCVLLPGCSELMLMLSTTSLPCLNWSFTDRHDTAGMLTVANQYSFLKAHSLLWWIEAFPWYFCTYQLQRFSLNMTEAGTFMTGLLTWNWLWCISWNIWHRIEPYLYDMHHKSNLRKTSSPHIHDQHTSCVVKVQVIYDFVAMEIPWWAICPLYQDTHMQGGGDRVSQVEGLQRPPPFDVVCRCPPHCVAGVRWWGPAAQLHIYHCSHVHLSEGGDICRQGTADTVSSNSVDTDCVPEAGFSLPGSGHNKSTQPETGWDNESRLLGEHPECGLAVANANIDLLMLLGVDAINSIQARSSNKVHTFQEKSTSSYSFLLVMWIIDIKLDVKIKSIDVWVSEYWFPCCCCGGGGGDGGIHVVMVVASMWW